MGLRNLLLSALIPPVALGSAVSDYSADPGMVRRYRDAAIAIADRKLAEVDAALARERPVEGLGRRLSSGGHFGGFFLWDSVFQSIWGACVAERDYPVESMLDNFYRLQLADGFIVREYSSRGLPCWSPDHPIALNPPILAWGELELFRRGRTGTERLERVYPKLKRFHEAVRARFRRPDGLYFGDQLGCGMDDIVRSPYGMSEADKRKGGIPFSEKCFGPGLMLPSLDAFRAHWLRDRSGDSSWNRQMGWIDITAQMALDCKCLAEISETIGRREESAAWCREHAEIARAVNELCWDESRGYYFDRWEGGIIPRYHGGSFWVMLAGIPTADRARRMLAAFDDPKLFGTPVPFPALAACDPEYRPETGYWCGQVWPPTAYVAIRGIAELGFRSEAERLARKYYNSTCRLWLNTKTVWENMSSRQCDSPKVRADGEFCGWAALAPVALPSDFGWMEPALKTSVAFCSPSVARVFKCRGTQPPAKAWTTVVAGPAADACVRTNVTADAVEYATGELRVSVSRRTGRVAFFDRWGRRLLAETGWGSGPRSQSFALRPDEPLYGLGDLQNGILDQRGVVKRLVSQNQGDGLAVTLSPRGYAILWDTQSPVRFSDTACGMRFETESGEPVDYYFLAGSIDGCTAGIRSLTGDTPMLPLWAYGFWQSRERYETQEQLLSVLRRYREERIPLDGIVQDWRYWGENNRWNAMTFDPAVFPDPKAMNDEIHRLHAHSLVSIWPSFGPDTEWFARFRDRGWLLPVGTWPDRQTRLYDPYCAASRELYWQAFAPLRAAGFDGWWLDATDPDLHGAKPSDLDLPVSAGCEWRRVRNAYPMACTEHVYRRWRESSSRRTVLLTRGASVGQQRCGTSVWSGDVDSSWLALHAQIPGGLNYSMTGNPQFNCDLGGFFGGSWLEKGGIANREWRELYVRWTQLGTYLPMMRSHGTGVRREIFLYGRRGEPVRDALEAAIRRRYALLPYLYSLAADATLSRGGLMRPLAADFPSDARACRVAQEFLLGRQLLIAPVVDRLYADGDDFTSPRRWSVYLPVGCRWREVESGERFEGGVREIPVTLASVPRFVREGSIVPVGPEVQWSGERPWDDLEIRVYPGADGEFSLYEDDFSTYAYERGEYSRIPFRWRESEGRLEIGDRRGGYPSMLKVRKFRINVVGRGTATATYRGSAVSVATASAGGAPTAQDRSE